MEKKEKEISFSVIHGIIAMLRFTCIYLVLTFILIYVFDVEQVSLVSLLLHPIYALFLGFEFFVGGKRGALLIKEENEKRRKDEGYSQ